MATNGDLGNEDRLPWLETVDEDYDEGPSVLRIAALVILGLALIAAIVYAVYWVQNRPQGAAGSGELIRAQEGDYKVKPEQRGGMQLDDDSAQSLATSEGAATADGKLDLDAVPEAPVKGKTATKTQRVTRSGDTIAVPESGGALKAAPPVSAPKTSAGGGGGGAVVQLGSFPTQAQAKTAWSRLSKRFSYVASLGQSVQKAEVNGNTVYRLRVNAGSANQAETLCGKLKVAGEACFIPND